MEIKRLLRRLMTEVADLREQRIVVDTHRSTLEAAIDARKVKLQSRRRNKRKADHAQQVADYWPRVILCNFRACLEW